MRAQTPAPAPVQFSPSGEVNKGLPGWIRFGGDYRSRFEGYTGGGFRTGATDAYWLSRVRLDLTIQPVSWLKVYAQAQDARVIAKQPAVPNFENTWDLHQAYGELGDFEKGAWSLRVGRQEINIGDQRLLGSSNWTNTARTFDAVRGMVKLGGFKVDAFASSVVNQYNDAWDHHPHGNNLYGLHAEITKVLPNATIEPYVLWHVQPGLRTELGAAAKLDEKVPGVRVVGKLPRGFDYQAEVVKEFGSLGSDDIKAWAGHWVLGRTFKAAWTPRPWIEYNYASGDANARDGVRGTFDHLYPTAHDKYGLADQVGWRNIKDFRGGVELKPHKNWTAVLEYNNWFLASALDALYNSGGTAIARSAAGTAGTHVGQELDIVATWAIAKPLQASAGFGHLFPGEFLKTTTPGHAYNYSYVMFTYKF